MPIKIKSKKSGLQDISSAQDILKLPLRLFYTAVGKIYDDDARIADRLYKFFPTYRSAYGELQNQLHRVCKKATSYDVQGLLIEPTNACNLLCQHCTTQRIPNAKKGFMDFELFKTIVTENPQLKCLILTRNGEPFTHSHIFEMIRFARDRDIYVSLYTNGTLLNDEKIPKIFESGLNEITFSMEGVGDFFEKNRGKPYALIESVINKVLEERSKRNSDLLVGINATVIDDPAPAIAVKETWEDRLDYVIMEPVMGGNKERRNAPCRTLWRNLVVTWNGDVVPCCVDMYNTLILGNVAGQSLREIFNGPKAQELRRCHLRSDFPKVCEFCYSYM